MSKLPELQDAMVEFALSQPLEEASRGIGLLPGVRDTLAALADAPGVVPCLVTGNLEPIGWLKMRALGLLPSFGEEPFGGFGSDFCSGNVAEMWKDRAELIRVAQRKASKLMAGQGALERIYHVGVRG